MNRFDKDLQRAAERLATEPLPERVLDKGLDGLEADRPPWGRLMGVIGAAAVLVLIVSMGLGHMLAALGPDATPTAIPDVTASAVPSPTYAESPSLEPIPAGPVVATVEEDGIRVTLELDRGQASFGDRVWALVTIENLGADTVHWGHSSTCDFAAGVAAQAEQPQALEYGRDDWQGTAEILKRVGVFVPDPEWGFTFTPEEWVGRETGFGCTTDFVADEVPPGGILSYRAAWDVTGPHCMPAPPGAYSVQGGFTYVSRGDPAPVGGDLPSVSVEVPFRVQGPQVTYLSPWEAVDAALGDGEFDSQFGGLSLERWVGADLEFVEAEWILRVNVENPDQSLVAEIDAVSGMVNDVSLMARTGPYTPLNALPCPRA